MLFITGGPSFSEFFLVEKFPTGLENYFTVCNWEERGGGISFNSEVTLESLTLEQLSSDVIEVTNYLRDRFKKEKIYIMAHSGVNQDLSKGYLKNLESPLKGFYTSKNSAHSPMFEEPQRFLEIIIKDALNNTTNLADN